MEVGTKEAWEQAKTVFNLGTLELSGKELKQARQQARPFVRLVSREVRHALGNQVLSKREGANRAELEVRGWSKPLVLRYPRTVDDGKHTSRARFDGFGIPLPTGKWKLGLRFSLGAGEKGEGAWSIVEWGLLSWGSESRVTTEVMPVLRDIHRRVDHLDLESWQGRIRPIGTFGWVGMAVEYTEFGADVVNSVRTVAADLGHLLDAAEPYQER